MSRSIWKYLVPVTDRADIEMPAGAQILHVHEQNGEICLWAVVDPAAKTRVRRPAVFGTGHQIGDGMMRYLGTAHLNGGQLVFHVFEAL